MLLSCRKFDLDSDTETSAVSVGRAPTHKPRAIGLQKRLETLFNEENLRPGVNGR